MSDKRFVIKHGFISRNDSDVTGSLYVSDLVYSNLVGSSSLNVLTASVSGDTITFTKGDGSSFPITIDTGSTTDITDLNNFTGSYFLDSASFSGSIAELEIWSSSLDLVTPSITGSSLATASVSLNTITFSKGDGSTFPIIVNTGSFTLNTSSFSVASGSQLQDFAESVDAALLKVRGTGVSTTYVSTVSVGGTTFAQPDVSGEINSDQGYFSISHTGATGISVNDLTASSTYVYIDNAGNRQQQTTTPTRQDWIRKMFTMRIGVDTDTNLILGFEYLNNPIGHYANSIRDLYAYLLAQGIPFKKDQVITGRAGDLGFDVSAGSFFEFGGTGNIDDPNTPDIAQEDNASYALMSRTAVVSTETNLVKFWDNADVITALGSTTFVGHRLYRFANGNFAMQYGQANYANINLAKVGVRTEEYVLNPLLKNATFFGWWLIEDTATNTGGTTLTDFIEYTIGVQGGSSNSLSGCLLKGNNLSDLLDAHAAIVNLGLTINGVSPVAGDITIDLDDIADGASRQIYTESDAEDSGKKSDTSFPVSPSNYQQFFRTDIGDMFYYDASRTKWLSFTTRQIDFYEDEASVTVTTHQMNHSSVTSTGNSTKYLFGEWVLTGVCIGNQATSATGNVRLYTGTTGAGTDIHSESYTGGGKTTLNLNVGVSAPSGVILKCEITVATVGIQKPEVSWIFRRVET
jgi:hypothetical protein